MPRRSSRVVDAFLHEGPALGPGGAGRVVASFLAEHVDPQVCVVLVDRQNVHLTLIVDASWAALASDLRAHHPDQFADFELPRDALRAVVRGWPSEWSPVATGLDVQHAFDGVPHLELVGRSDGPPVASRHPRRAGGRRRPTLGCLHG